MSESPHENRAYSLGMFLSLIPALIASDFMPGANVLPFGVWLAIATAGGALAGGWATPRRVEGLLSGAIAAGGGFLGMVLYVQFRSGYGNTYARLELVLAYLLGAAPGAVLYRWWARPKAG